MYRKKVSAKLLSFLLSFSLAFSAVPTAVTFAAEKNAIIFQSAAYNESAVDKALDAVNTAKKTGRQEDINKADELVNALSPTNKVRLYVKLSGDYYLKNYKNSDFKFFNVKKYLEDNPDVKKAAAAAGAKDIEAFALDHYLEFGVYEARGSYTDFDPIAAIISTPAVLDGILPYDGPLPEEIFKKHLKLTGSKSTKDIDVSFAAPKDESGDIDDDPSTYVLFAYDYDDYEYTYSEEESGNGQGQDNEPSQDPTPAPTPTPTPTPSPSPAPQPKSTHFNAKSEDITPYTLYTQSGTTTKFSFTTNNSFSNPNAGKNVEVTFFGENYAKAKGLAKDKKFTLMMYACGTDLERDGLRVTQETMDMLKADMSNVNVILIVGGTTQYQNTYMNNDSADASSIGASGLRTGIYYLNPDGLSNDVKNTLSSFDLLEAYKTKDGSGYTDSTGKVLLRFDDVLNEKTMIQLSSTTAIDMGDPSLLAGFINFSTNLFPASDYGLILSDHGGGAESGVCFSDSLEENGQKIITGTEITMPELESALSSTDLYLNKSRAAGDGKLGFLFFDACLMGSTEVAYNLKDFYRYMGGSEEVARAGAEYGKIINSLNSDVAQNSNDRTIATNFVKQYTTNPYFQGYEPLGMEASMAVFSSADMEDMYSKFNTLSRGLTDILGSEAYSAGMKNDVFKAIRKASLSCYSLNDDSANMVDLGEFLSFLKSNITALATEYSRYSESDIAALRKITSSLDQVLNSGFLVYLSVQNLKGLGSLKKEAADGVISLNYTLDGSSPLWTDARTGKTGKKDYIYGSSIAMPVGFDLNVENFRESELYKYYSDSPLKDYISFLDTYYSFYDSEGGYKDNINALSGELANLSVYEKLIRQVEDGNTGYTSTISDNGKKLSYITLKVADTYEEVGLTTPAHSTGSPMLDIMETHHAIQVAAVHKEYFQAHNDKDNTDKYLLVDMICAEQPLSRYSYALDSNTIVLDVTDATNSVVKGLALHGTTFDIGTDSPIGEYDWQFVLKSDLEKKSDSKAAAIKAVFSDSSQIDPKNVVSIFGGYVISEASKNENTGESETVYKEYPDGYHLFSLKDDKMYHYSGTVYGENNQYTLVDNVAAISAYHYVLNRTLDSNKDPIINKQILEDYEGISASYFALPALSGKELFIEDVEIVEETKAVNGVSQPATALKTGYVLDMWGNGSEYTNIAFPAGEAEYASGETVGNGPLRIDVTKLSDDLLSQIGILMDNKEDYEGYTDKPFPEVPEDLPPIAAAKDANNQAAGSTVIESQTSGTPSVTGYPVEQSITDAGASPITQNVLNASDVLLYQNAPNNQTTQDTIDTLNGQLSQDTIDTLNGQLSQDAIDTLSGQLSQDTIDALSESQGDGSFDCFLSQSY